MLKINFTLPVVLKILKLQNPLWPCLNITDHTHLKLNYQFLTSMDVSLHAKNQLCKSYNFYDIKVLKILQSDWVREPEFSRTCTFHTIVQTIHMPDFKQELN